MSSLGHETGRTQVPSAKGNAIILPPSPEVSGYDRMSKAVRRSSVLTKTEVFVYQEVVSFAEASSNGICSASARVLGDVCDLSSRQIRTILNRLVEVGLLHRTHRVRASSLLVPVPITLDLVVKLRPRTITHRCWRALWARYRDDPWVQEHCPEAAKAGTVAAAGGDPASRGRQQGEAGFRPYEEESYKDSDSPRNASHSSSRREDPPSPQEGDMTRRDRAPKKRIQDVTSGSAYSEEKARQDDRVKKKSKQTLSKYRAPQEDPAHPKPAERVDPLDLSHVDRWKSMDFVRMIRAACKASGIKCLFNETLPNGRLAHSIARTTQIMNQFRELLASSGIRTNQQQAVFLKVWIRDWKDFMRPQRCQDVGFIPAYWTAAWNNIFPWLRNHVMSDMEYINAAPVSTEDHDAMIRNGVLDIYPEWVDEPEVLELAVKALRSYKTPPTGKGDVIMASYKLRGEAFDTLYTAARRGIPNP